MKSLAITSGKGGVGKTNVAVNLALALGARGARVLLLDADLGLANADVVLGLSPAATLADALFRGEDIRSVLVAVNDHVSLLPSSSGVLQLERLTPDRRAMLGDALDALTDEFDYLLVDTGAGLGETVIFFNDLVDGVLLVTVPEPSALTDAYAMIKVLSRSCGHTHLSLLVNQAASATSAAAVHERLADVAQRFLSVRVDMAGYVPTDPALLRAISQRKPVLELEPGAPSSRAVTALAAKVDTLCTPQAETPRKRLFQAWSQRNTAQRSAG